MHNYSELNEEKSFKFCEVCGEFYFEGVEETILNIGTFWRNFLVILEIIVKILPLASSFYKRQPGGVALTAQL